MEIKEFEVVNRINAKVKKKFHEYLNATMPQKYGKLQTLLEQLNQANGLLIKNTKAGDSYNREILEILKNIFSCGFTTNVVESERYTIHNNYYDEYDSDYSREWFKITDSEGNVILDNFEFLEEDIEKNLLQISNFINNYNFEKNYNLADVKFKKDYKQTKQEYEKAKNEYEDVANSSLRVFKKSQIEKLKRRYDIAKRNFDKSVSAYKAFRQNGLKLLVNVENAKVAVKRAVALSARIIALNKKTKISEDIEAYKVANGISTRLDYFKGTYKLVFVIDNQLANAIIKSVISKDDIKEIQTNLELANAIQNQNHYNENQDCLVVVSGELEPQFDVFCNSALNDKITVALYNCLLCKQSDAKITDETDDKILAEAFTFEQ